MAVVQTLIGNIKGPQGEQGATGATGAPGSAATINVGSVTTTAYGNPAQITNSGTESAAVFDFVIPQGKPGEATTTMGNLTLDSITTSTASFPSPQVGDTGKTAWGKVVKFFADTVAALNSKLNTANVVNNLTTTSAGYALDARQGKALNDSLPASQNAMFTDSITVPANSTVTVTHASSEAPTGYRYFAPYYLTSGNSNVILAGFTIDGSGQFGVTFRNLSGSSVTSTATIRIRCTKNL